MVKKKFSPKTKKSEEVVKYIRLKATMEELDRIAKLLVRRDLELLETKEKLQQSLIELREINIELQEKIKELEKFRKLTLGREIKMIELKQEIKKLKSK